MKYNFDEINDRRGSNSVKWDECPSADVIPMWVADMDFKAAPFILEALRRRVEHGVFGYTYVPDAYYRSVCDWFAKRRGWKIQPEWIQYISGIVPALSVAVEALSSPGDNVLIHAPAYNCFYSSIRNNGRIILESSLICDGKGQRPSFSIDFEDFERKCADPRTTLFILCNPHNPSGRIWTREELTRMGEICRANGVTVVSDEIHCELEMPGQQFIPFASISEENQQCSVTFNSPTKSFNIAGLEIANIIASDPEKYAKINKVINRFEHCDVNPFGVDALMAAYSDEGEEWLKELNAYIYDNYLALEKKLSEAAAQVKLCKLEGTYLAWMDCSAYTAKGISTKEMQDSMVEHEKVWINGGAMYGDGDYMRINLACPRGLLLEGADRIVSGLGRIMSELSR